MKAGLFLKAHVKQPQVARLFNKLQTELSGKMYSDHSFPKSEVLWQWLMEWMLVANLWGNFLRNIITVMKCMYKTTLKCQFEFPEFFFGILTWENIFLLVNTGPCKFCVLETDWTKWLLTAPQPPGDLEAFFGYFIQTLGLNLELGVQRRLPNKILCWNLKICLFIFIFIYLFS